MNCQQMQSMAAENQSAAVSHAVNTAVADCGVQVQSMAAENQSAAVSHAVNTAVADCGVQVQLQSCCDDELDELRQLREEVKMLRLKCQRTSGLMLSSLPTITVGSIHSTQILDTGIGGVLCWLFPSCLENR